MNHSDLDLTSGYISTVSRNQLNSTMDLPVERVQLLKHAGIGQKLTWDLQVNSNAVSVKLVWIKAGKPVEKTGDTTSQAQKKKHLSPSTRRRNAKRMDQWKVKREAVGDNTTCVKTQTADINPSTDETTQTDQHNSDAQAFNIPTVSTKKRERSTQTRCTYSTGSLPKPTKFDPDDPARIDRFPEYTPDIDIGDRPPTHEICSGRRPSKKKKYLSAIPEQGRQTLNPRKLINLNHSNKVWQTLNFKHFSTSRTSLAEKVWS